MSYLCYEKGQAVMYSKGATEVMVDRCYSYIATPSGPQPLTPEVKELLHNQMVKMADGGLRVLALAYKHLNEEDVGDVRGAEVNSARGRHEKEMVFLGMVGLMDPPRPESAPSIAKCHRAGIAVHMATGDHPLTGAYACMYEEKKNQTSGARRA